MIPACQKKATPVITDRKVPPRQRTTYTYSPVADIPVDTVRGKILFRNSCNRCHGLPAPEQFTGKIWDMYLASMFPRTGLSNEEAIHVTAYLKANAQK